MTSIKLIVSIATIGSGGAERVLSVLSNNFVQEFDSVEYVLWKHSEIFYTVNPNVTIIDIEKKCGSKNELKKIRWFRKYIRQNPSSIILSFLYPYSFRVLISLMGIRRNIIVAERRDPRKVKGGKIFRILRDVLYIKAKKILVQTPSNSNGYSCWLQNKINTIPNPINLPEKFQGIALTTVKNNTIVSVGRLIPEKNHEMLINAFAKFSKNHPEFKLIIYGEGPLRNKLSLLINSLKMTSKIDLAGNHKDVISKIASARLFILSSISEGMPNALFEAMAIGLPCISTRVNASCDYIIDKKNGILINQKDENHLIEAMELIVNNKDFAEELGQNATYVNKILNPDKIGEKWIKEIIEI